MKEEGKKVFKHVLPLKVSPILYVIHFFTSSFTLFLTLTYFAENVMTDRYGSSERSTSSLGDYTTQKCKMLKDIWCIIQGNTYLKLLNLFFRWSLGSPCYPDCNGVWWTQRLLIGIGSFLRLQDCKVKK